MIITAIFLVTVTFSDCLISVVDVLRKRQLIATFHYTDTDTDFLRRNSVGSVRVRVRVRVVEFSYKTAAPFGGVAYSG